MTITLHHLCFSHCVNLSLIVWTSVFFFRSCTPSEKYLNPKQSPPISHNDLKKDGVQLLLSKYKPDVAAPTCSTIPLCKFIHYKMDFDLLFNTGGYQRHKRIPW